MGTVDPIETEKRLRALNAERQKSMVSDTNKLLKLASELNAEINRENPDSLTPAQLSSCLLYTSRVAVKLADAMIDRFYDRAAGAFYDTAAPQDGQMPLGVLAARRKPLQDTPTPEMCIRDRRAPSPHMDRRRSSWPPSHRAGQVLVRWKGSKEQS